MAPVSFLSGVTLTMTILYVIVSRYISYNTLINTLNIIDSIFDLITGQSATRNAAQQPSAL